MGLSHAFCQIGKTMFCPPCFLPIFAEFLQDLFTGGNQNVFDAFLSIAIKRIFAAAMA
jgi:hypothetical protein